MISAQVRQLNTQIKCQYCHCDITRALNACSTKETDCKSTLNSGLVISAAYPKQKPEALLGMCLEHADKKHLCLWQQLV